MNYLYLVTTAATTFPAAAAENLKIASVTKYVFEGSSVTVFEVGFFKMTHINSLQTIATACPRTRVVCAKRSIFVGLTPQSVVVWSVRIAANATIAFSTVNNQYAPDWRAAEPQPETRTIRSSSFFTKMTWVQTGHVVHVQCDITGQMKVRDGRATTHTGQHPAAHFKPILNTAPFLLFDDATRDAMGVRVDADTVLPNGLHPYYAADTANGARVHIGVCDDSMRCGAVITTLWDGRPCNPPLQFAGPAGTSLHDAQELVFRVWACTISLCRGHDADASIPETVTGPAAELVKSMEMLSTTEEVLAEGVMPLCVGEYIAYLLPNIPPENQGEIITTRVVGLIRDRPCFVKLENGHHTTILASGKVHVGRYSPVTGRVQFPLEKLSAFRA